MIQPSRTYMYVYMYMEVHVFVVYIPWPTPQHSVKSCPVYQGRHLCPCIRFKESACTDELPSTSVGGAVVRCSVLWARLLWQWIVSVV